MDLHQGAAGDEGQDQLRPVTVGLPRPTSAVRLSARGALWLGAIGLVLALLPAAPVEAIGLPTTDRLVIGHSVQGRDIVAYHRYSQARPGARVLLVIGQMHGDEKTGRRVIDRLRSAPLPAGLDMWLIPTVNPDGNAHNTRGNAHRVDLNRNFPVTWLKRGAGTRYYSGPRARSEPETRAVQAFVRELRPWRTVSFHNPLYGVDASLGKDRSLAKNLAKWSGYPLRSFTCNSGCHGTMTQFINKRTPGAAVTFEFGHSTSAAQLNRVVRAVLRVGTP